MLVLRRCTNVARLCKERKIWIIHGCMVIFPQTFLKQQGICPVCRVDFVTLHSVHYLFPSHTRKVPKIVFEELRDIRSDKLQPCSLKLCRKVFFRFRFSKNFFEKYFLGPFVNDWITPYVRKKNILKKHSRKAPVS